MVTLRRAAAWRIAIYGRDHGVPHFHVEGRGWRCSVAIATLDLIVGRAPPAVLEEARNWAAANKTMLMAKWRELNG